MRRAALPLLAVAGLLLAGCTPTVTLTPAPQATTVGCARVIVALPGSIAGLDRRSTDAQGTAAWGPDPAITLVCGGGSALVPDCGTVEGVDWTVSAARIGDRTVTVRTTYGRDPAVRIVKPADGESVASGVSASDVLLAVTDAVKSGTRSTGVRCAAAIPHPTGTPAR